MNGSREGERFVNMFQSTVEASRSTPGFSDKLDPSESAAPVGGV